jgi:hypothetical protein
LLQRGVAPDTRRASILRGLFEARSATVHSPSRDAHAGAARLGRADVLWQAWSDAAGLIAQRHPRQALERVTAAVRIHALESDGVAGIVDLELSALLAQCAEEGYQPVGALQWCDRARDTLLHGILARWPQEGSIDGELVHMIELLTRSAIAPQEREGWARAWAVARGVRLLCELAERRVRLLAQVSGARAADEALEDLPRDLLALHEASGAAFGESELADIEFAFGECLTERHPEEAFRHFDWVSRARGVGDGLGLHGAVNAANCLLRCGRFAEAESRYGSLESLFEMRGDYAGAARIWTSECIARWKRTHDPAVRHQVIGAIKMFEETLHGHGDPYTLFTQKRFIEQAYLLLLTANASAADRSDGRLDEMLAALWALQSRDQLARLEEAMPSEPWEAMLAREWRPLAATKTLLAALPGVGIVHIVAGIDVMVWIIYGADPSGNFRFAAACLDADSAGPVAGVLAAMDEQIAADKVGDALAVYNLDARIDRLGEQIGKALPPDWRAVLDGMQILVYMPHPFGNVDEFPLGAVRFDGRSLMDRMPLMRSPNVAHLRELMSPSRPGLAPQRRAVVVTGAPDLAGDRLEALDSEAALVQSDLRRFGFDTVCEPDARRNQLRDWLDGDAGALHYLGHGLASEVYEALPLPCGEHFGPLDADKLDGFKVPFVFICACVAARVRHGAGGYSVGTASKLVERGAPGVICFSTPVPERHAYRLARRFYREAKERPLSEAVRGTLQTSAGDVPAYARLAFTAYGDPDFRLPDMAGEQPVRLLSQRNSSWASALRKYCVLRTPDAKAVLKLKLATAPAGLRTAVEAWIEVAFQSPARRDDELLERWEREALQSPEANDAERLTLRAAILLERAHANGLDCLPLRPDTAPAAVRRAHDEAVFLARLGSALFDTGLNGLGCTLAGRVIVCDQNDAVGVAPQYLREGREKLLAFELLSPFVRDLRLGNATILKHFGHPA